MEYVHSQTQWGDFVVRTMTRNELDLAVEWAAREGWNPGWEDADCFYAADPNGFFLGELNGEPIGCISVVAYDNTFGFLGFYIVKPEWRGKGFGLWIWNAGMAYLGGRNVGLDGVLAQQDNYKKSGFSLAYRNIRYEGVGAKNISRAAAEIVSLAEVAFDQIVEYDRRMFPVNRTEFLRLWIQRPQSRAVGIVEHGTLAGYAVLRPCRKGYKFGPMFADNPTLARTLFAYLSSQVPHAPIFLDTPEVNPAAVALADSMGMQRVFETARMYTHSFPDIALDRIYGVTTFELG